jgi:transcriptional regulator with XRE-family HTH domain
MATATRHRGSAGGAPRVAIGADESVRYLRRQVGMTEVDLADGTGASTRTVRRWLASDATTPQRRFATQLDDLRTIAKTLEESLTHKGIRQWLRARNRLLDDQRPIDLLREGHFDRVHQAAQAFNEGYYV